jgi:hypothetical protein
MAQDSDRLTRYQRELLREIEQIASIVKLDYQDAAAAVGIECGLRPTIDEAGRVFRAAPGDFRGLGSLFSREAFCRDSRRPRNLRNGHAMLPADFYQRFSARYRA